LSLALYAATLAPGLTWAHHGADGGDLLAAALTGGVPHPPGYPAYQLLLRGAIALLPAAPAHAGAWLSALAAAAATALLADLARRSLPAQSQRRGLAALIAALCWAAAPALWGQAVITEVYTLHGAFCLLCLWLLWRSSEARQAGGDGLGWLSAAGLAAGLGLGVHLTLALIVPGALVWLVMRPTPLRWRSLLAALSGLLLGLCVYVYLPLAAAGAPAVNWGDPRTPDRFWWVATGQLYRPLVFGLPAAQWPGRLADWAMAAIGQLGGGPWGALLAALGLARLLRQRDGWGVGTALTALAPVCYALGYNADDAEVLLLPAWAMAALWLAHGLDGTLAWASAHAARDAKANEKPRSDDFSRSPLPTTKVVTTKGWVLRAGLPVILALALPGLTVARSWSRMNLSQDRTAERFVDAALSAAAPGAVILTASDESTFALWYAVFGLGRRPDVTPVNVHLYGTAWYQTSLAAARPGVFPPAGYAGASWPDFETFLAEAARRRPLYRAEPLGDAVIGFQEEDSGGLVRLWWEHGQTR
jgi:hypothetical protein